MKKIILSFLLIGSFSTLLFAQSSFLEKGQNGFLVSGVSSANQNLSGYSGAIGYSLSGVLDFGVSLGQYGYYKSYKSNTYENLKATIISPFLSYIVLKQDKSIPLSISLNSSYHNQLYEEDYLDKFYSKMVGDYFRIGPSVFTNIKISNAIKIQPKAGFRYITGKIRFEDSSGGSATKIHDSAIFDLEVSFMLNTPLGSSYILTPGMGIQKDLTNLSLSVSYLLPNN